MCGEMVITRIPAEEADPPSSYGIVGLMLMATQLIQHPATEEVLLDMISCTLGIVDLELGHAVMDHQAIALEELSDSKA